MMIKKYIKKKSIQRVLAALCCVIIAVTVVGRLIAGVHWFTDILGGILISISLLSLFSAIINWKEKELT